MKRQFFGTDGVRGVFGGPVINEPFAERLGVAAGRYVSRQTHAGAQRVLVGRDTRESGEALAHAVVSGLAAVGVESILLGILPTPAVAAAVVRERAALGVMVTASHNPPEHNGIKFFTRRGTKLTDQQEFEIEQLLPVDQPTLIMNRARNGDGLRPYLDKVEALLPLGALAGWKIVLDTANGASCVTSPRVFKFFGAEVIGIGDTPNGSNINQQVGSEHPDVLAARVLHERAQLGVAHDGDGDRCVLCDETGSVLDGDEILAILAVHALQNGRLRERALVVTVHSNLGLDATVAAAGGRVMRTAVGDRYVLERMLLENAGLGGESSGHIICLDTSPTGDGLVAALKVIEVMLATGRPLSELRKVLRKFPQRTLALVVKEKREIATLPHLPMAIQALENELGHRGRVLVRYSGTEDKLRILVEGPTEDIVRAGLSRIEAIARTDLTVS